MGAWVLITETWYYGYDGLGRRVSAVTSGVTTRTLMDGQRELGQYDGSGNLLSRYIYGPGLDEHIVTVAASGAKTWLHADQLNTVVADSSATGAVGSKYAYGPYGETRSLTGSNFRFTGRVLDANTGLYYYRARMYSPVLGRFMQVDPSGYQGGKNLYRYVNNDPLNLTDSSGMAVDGTVNWASNHQSELATAGIVGLTVAATIATGGLAAALLPEEIAMIAGEEAAVAGAEALGAAESAPTIGNILSGYGSNTMIHLTPEAADAFAGGVESQTFFAQLGDVSEMTVPEYQANVVMPIAAAGPGQAVSGFVVATPEAGGAFTPAGIFNNANVMEYTNSRLFNPSGYVPLP